MDKTEVFKTADKLKSLYLENWQNHLTSWKFWLLVFLLIVPWIIFVFIVNKKKLLEIGFFGLAICILSSFLDQLGVSFVLWGYPIKVVPAIPTFTPASFSILPVVFMLLYQYFNDHSKRFYVGAILFSAAMAFITQPLLSKYGFYVAYRWSYAASFLTSVIIVVIARAFTNCIIALNKKHNQTNN